MWVLAGLVLLTAASGQAATLEKPVLTVHPPWATIFRGESVTLHCAGHHALILEPRPIRTLWYRGHLLLPTHTRTLEVQAAGVYRCQTRGAPVSDPVHLSVSNDWLILQAPPVAVFEGDPLVLRCRARADRPVQRLHFYHEGRAVRYYPAGANYTVAQARAGDSGHYQCSGTMRIPAEGAGESAPLFSAKVAVRVQELFPAPVLRAAGPGPAGGLVLRCDTRPHARRRATPLLFAFYLHGRAVRAFGPAPEITVPARPAPDLDAYWCEAATASRSVRKRSLWTPPAELLPWGSAGEFPAPDPYIATG
ncbi:Fc receptor-like B [Sorex araneus]|uniref:Fc receptor-like B n=1 Tax=Sorex araneus TaxID=42254 RepID=UPI0024340008|nr:Fc receptor-like B [Sorex araneus]